MVAADNEEALLEKPPLWFEAGHARIIQVVGNLLDNAARYAPRGAEISLARSEGLGVSLTFDGPGVDLAVGRGES